MDGTRQPPHQPLRWAQHDRGTYPRSPSREVAKRGADPAPGCRPDSGGGCATSTPASVAAPVGLTHPSVLESSPPLYRWATEALRGRELNPGLGLALGWLWFRAGVHPVGPGGSLSASADSNICTVGSDGPISRQWPTAVGPAPYQSPGRPTYRPPGKPERPAEPLSLRGCPCQRRGSRACPGGRP